MYFSLMIHLAMMAILATASPQQTLERIIPITRRSSGLVNADKSVNFAALNSYMASVETKIHRGFANFERNTRSVHSAAMKGLRKRGVGEPLMDVNTELWYGPISVGTPGQNFTVAFATGSSDLFLPASDCDLTCSGHNTWNPASSSTDQDLNRTFNLTYNDGSSTSGEQYTDTVSIAGFTATTQTFGAAYEYSSGFQSSVFPPDGVMGLGFQAISHLGASPAFQTLLSEGQVTDSVFSFKLSATAGELYIGGSDSSMYTGDFSWTSVTKQGYWEVYMDYVEGNGVTLMSNIDVIFDTGTTLIIGLASDVSWLYQALNGTAISSTYGQGYYSFPCDSFPDISLYFGGTGFAISTSTLNLGPVTSGSSDCVSGIVANQDSSASFWIIGDIFLQGVYTAFDVGNLQVGLAQLA